MNTQRTTNDLMAMVICFLLDARAAQQSFNGRSADEAYRAFCELFGYSPDHLAARLRPGSTLTEPGDQA